MIFYRLLILAGVAIAGARLFASVDEYFAEREKTKEAQSKSAAFIKHLEERRVQMHAEHEEVMAAIERRAEADQKHHLDQMAELERQSIAAKEQAAQLSAQLDKALGKRKPTPSV